MLKKHPTKIIRAAIEGMIPKTRIRPTRYERLKVYAGPENPHEAQTSQTPKHFSLSLPSQVRAQSSSLEDIKETGLVVELEELEDSVDAKFIPHIYKPEVEAFEQQQEWRKKWRRRDPKTGW
eukprot:TRINITY_DN2502_c0_g1_i1.p1 TRINITY_DN2502_c0_g1~~TRINITY_DN2502_c0_g1_i1.p1  ORF type:complete len:122 (-),score=10.30 TRINITY_DN2502_c0_g1_i1:40-405(-)